MNFTLLSKVNWLEQEVSNISGIRHDIISSIGSQASEVYNALEEFKNEQSWISRIDMQVDTKGINHDEAIAIFTWQVKEFEKASQVVFHYSFGDREEYHSVTAEELQKGLFQVKVPFEFKKEPQWRLGQITSDSYYSEEVSEKEKIDSLHDTINFYVTVSNNDLDRSSEIQQEFLDELRASYYGSIQTDIHIFNSKLDITLINYLMDEKSKYVEKAILLKYKGNTLIGEEELQGVGDNSLGNMENFFHLNQVDKYENIRLVMKVVYNTGDTFEKEIY